MLLTENLYSRFTMNLDTTRIGIIGLGYVGLPLAVEFGKHFPTVGFDLKPDRVAELRAGLDSTREITPEELQAASQLSYITDPADLANCNVYRDARAGLP